MKKFSDFKIKPSLSAFTGDKIKIEKILNIPIKVLAFKIEPSKHTSGKCLTLQIEKNNTQHVVFTGSTILMQMIQEVPEDGFPFETTIVKESEHLEFT